MGGGVNEKVGLVVMSTHSVIEYSAAVDGQLVHSRRASLVVETLTKCLPERLKIFPVVRICYLVSYDNVSLYQLPVSADW